MGIREEREAQAAKFVSIRNLVEVLASEESIQIGEVAGFLLGKLVREGSPQFVRRDRQSLTHHSASNNLLDKLLRMVSDSNSFEGDSWDEISSDNFDSYGWMRAEMANFLKSVGLTPPASCSAHWKPEPKKPSWHRAYINRAELTLNEAVAILLGIDPDDNTPVATEDDDEFQTQWRRWEKALIDAVDNFPIEGTTWGNYRGAEQKLSHRDIKAWASTIDAPWPFLDSSPTTQASGIEGSELVRALAEARKRIAELEAQRLHAEEEKSMHAEAFDALVRQLDSYEFDLQESQKECKQLSNQLESAIRECSTLRQQLEASQPERPLEIKMPPLIAIAIEVFQKEWQGQLNPSKEVRDRANQDAIVEGLKERHPDITNAVAKAIDKVASPIDRDPKNPSGKYQLRSS